MKYKTLLGNVEDINEIFSDFKVCLNETAQNRGSYTLSPKGYYFIGGLRGPGNRDGSYQHIAGKSYFLHSKPTEKAIKTAEPHCVNGQVGSFEIIKWVDKALVIARDREMLASIWLAFIPLEQIPQTDKLELYPSK